CPPAYISRRAVSRTKPPAPPVIRTRLPEMSCAMPASVATGVTGKPPIRCAVVARKGRNAAQAEGLPHRDRVPRCLCRRAEPEGGAGSLGDGRQPVRTPRVRAGYRSRTDGRATCTPARSDPALARRSGHVSEGARPAQEAAKQGAGDSGCLEEGGQAQAAAEAR